MSQQIQPRLPKVSDATGDVAVEDELGEFVAQAELTGVRFARVAGELAVDEPAAVAGVTQKIQPEVRLRIDGFDCRFGIDTRILDIEHNIQATITVDVIASFGFPAAVSDDGAPLEEVSEEMEPPSGALMQRFVQQVAYFVVFPYVRETVQSISTRLGLGAMTLGLLRADGGPTSFSIAPVTVAEIANA